MVKHKVYLYLAEVERLTHEISAMSEKQAFSPKMIIVSGMHITKRCKVTIDVNKQNIIDAISPVVHTILRMIEGGLKKTYQNYFQRSIRSRNLPERRWGLHQWNR